MRLRILSAVRPKPTLVAHGAALGMALEDCFSHCGFAHLCHIGNGEALLLSHHLSCLAEILVKRTKQTKYDK